MPLSKTSSSIISIRSSEEYPDEDGIWHDDGSRVLAFSLSLTRHPGKPRSGKLRSEGVRLLRLRHPFPLHRLAPMIIFGTGQSGFEHRICRVARGERVIVAGWAS